MASFFTIILGLVIFLAVAFVLINVYLEFLGAPFVPTFNNLDEIFKKAKLKKGQVFMDLGSGDGRVVRKAVKNYGVYGIGIEINPYLVVYANLAAKLENLTNIQFKRQSLFEVDLEKADIIFVFLKPNMLKKLAPKLTKCKKGSLIIAQGFQIPGWDKYLVDKIERKVFSTYFYKTQV